MARGIAAAETYRKARAKEAIEADAEDEWLGSPVCPKVNDPPQPPAILEFQDATDFGEQSIVLPLANVIAWLEDRAPLAHDNRAARDELSGEPLDAEPLRVGIAPVT